MGWASPSPAPHRRRHHHPRSASAVRRPVRAGLGDDLRPRAHPLPRTTRGLLAHPGRSAAHRLAGTEGGVTSISRRAFLKGTAGVAAITVLPLAALSTWVYISS